jgi:hypothetical protein
VIFTIEVFIALYTINTSIFSCAVISTTSPSMQITSKFFRATMSQKSYVITGSRHHGLLQKKTEGISDLCRSIKTLFGQELKPKLWPIVRVELCVINRQKMITNKEWPIRTT